MAKRITQYSLQLNSLETDMADETKLYVNLRQKINKAGILKRSYAYYILLSLIIFGGFALSVFQVYYAFSPFYIILWSLCVAFFAVQIGGLVHDAGHRAIFQSARMNDCYGYISGLIVAEGYHFWKNKHNAHHANPNEEDKDPDIEFPLMSFTQEKYDSRKGVARAMRKYQHYLYFPLGILVAFSLRFDSLKYIIQKKSYSPQLVFFCISLFFWFIAPFLIFPMTKALIIFFALHGAMGLYLLNIFAPNHKGMPEMEKNIKISFLKRQIMTSRNINAHWLTDFLYMGLNYQIEHHLFPHCPRNKLRLLVPYVRAVSHRMNLEYTSVNFWQTNRIILSELRQVAASP